MADQQPYNDFSPHDVLPVQIANGPLNVKSSPLETLLQAILAAIPSDGSGSTQEAILDYLLALPQDKVSAVNSTNTPLGINETFTGEWEDTLGYSELIVSVESDKASVTDGLQVQWSADGITVHETDDFTVPTNTGKTWSFPCNRKYVRIFYQNDGVIQTSFNLETILKVGASKGSSHRLKDNLSQEDDAIVTKSQIVGQSSTGGGSNLVNVKVNPSGALTVDATISGTVPLPTGASTAANQVTGNDYLASIDGKLSPEPDFARTLTGRLRTADLFGLGSYKKMGYDNPLVWDGVGTGSNSFANNRSTITVTSGQYYIRQTRRKHPYLPAKPQIFELTCFNFHTQANVTKRLGYFSSSTSAPYTANFDGIFIEDDGTEKSWQFWRNGSLVNKIILTTALAGYDFETFTAFEMDFLWLGGVGARLFIAKNGEFELIASYAHAGVVNDLIMLNPQQPIRYEIRSTTGSGTFTEVCSQVSTEGSINPQDGLGYAHRHTATLTTGGTRYLLLAIRLQDALRQPFIQLVKSAINPRGQAVVDYEIVLNPVIANDPGTWTAITNTPIEYLNGNGTTYTVTGGATLAADSTSSGISISEGFNNWNFALGQKIDGTRDILALVATPVANNATVYGSAGWVEV